MAAPQFTVYLSTGSEDWVGTAICSTDCQRARISRSFSHYTFPLVLNSETSPQSRRPRDETWILQFDKPDILIPGKTECGNGLLRGQRFPWFTFVLIDMYANDGVKNLTAAFLVQITVAWPSGLTLDDCIGSVKWDDWIGGIKEVEWLAWWH